MAEANENNEAQDNSDFSLLQIVGNMLVYSEGGSRGAINSYNNKIRQINAAAEGANNEYSHLGRTGLIRLYDKTVKDIDYQNMRRETNHDSRIDPLPLSSKLSGKDPDAKKITDSAPRTGNPVQLGRYDANKVKRDTERIADEETKDSIRRYGDRAQQSIAESAYSRYGDMDPYWNYNHARNNIRGNINGMNYYQTLNRSRLADSLNNRFHAMPTDIGSRAVTGEGISGSGTGVEGATPKQWQPITTQEMRQMRANERLDESARMGDQSLANKVRGYGYELQFNADRNKQQLAQQLGIADIEVNKALRNAMISVDVNLNEQTRMGQIAQRFAQELALEVKDRGLRNVLQMYIDDPAFTGLVAQAYLGIYSVPDMMQILTSSVVKNMWQGSNPYADPEGAMNDVVHAQRMFQSMLEYLIQGGAR